MEVVCRNCSRKMVKLQSGFTLSDYPINSTRPIVQRGDLFECPNCECQVFASFGNRHVAGETESIVWVE